MKRQLITLLFLLLTTNPLLAASTYQTPEAFLKETFAGKVPAPAVIWLNGERKTSVSKILGHAYGSLRVRYWKTGKRSAWILEEVGKDLPITTGVVINDERIERIRVLIFRESRGWEVRHSFFTDQFKSVSLKKDTKLDRSIDNISGATLSVRALKKIARLALYLHQQVSLQDVAPSP